MRPLLRRWDLNLGSNECKIRPTHRPIALARELSSVQYKDFGDLGALVVDGIAT